MFKHDYAKDAHMHACTHALYYLFVCVWGGGGGVYERERVCVCVRERECVCEGWGGGVFWPEAASGSGTT